MLTKSQIRNTYYIIWWIKNIIKQINMKEKLNKKSASKNSYLDYFLKVNKIINTIIHKY